jgi:putative heme-binding domain-containing protein
MKRFCVRSFAVVLSGVLSVAARAQEPEWIWSSGHAGADESCFGRATFSVAGSVSKATLMASADNHVIAYLNGEKVGSSDDWGQPLVVDVSTNLKPGENVIALLGRNDGGSAAMIAKLSVVQNGKTNLVATGKSWKVSKQAGDGWQKAGYTMAGWTEPHIFGKIGMAPWGEIFAGARGAGGRNGGGVRSTSGGGHAATPADQLDVLADFHVELIRNAEAGEGSWVSMAVDPKGRIYISSQGGEPMLRFTLDESGHIAKKDTIDVPVHGAMGLLWANDSLYVNGGGPQGYSLYRLTDSNGDDKLDKVDLIHATQGGGEHGTHGILLGPDNRLYVVSGNFVKPPDANPASPHQHFADDLILARAEDGNGFGANKTPPGGYVMRMDLNGSNCVLFASGQRNDYDIAFNADGELFGFDSDMEWDWALPWYRPTRICHYVSGGDQGFREGSAKWPEWYQDSLPATLNIGIGSPTGTKFGTGAKFPEKYQRALFAMDWAYGRILAVHLTPKGSTYSATFENFVRGKPFNVTDLEIGRDGAMYFATGGRGTQSGLYRVTYAGKESTALSDAKDKAGAEARATRHELEKFHGHQDPKAVATAWPNLASDDRFMRYAARIAIEFQPVAEWKDKALAETNPNAGLTALLALARMGGKENQDAIFAALKKFPMNTLSEEQQLLKLRIVEVSIARNGKPSPEFVALAIEKLSPLYPAASDAMNRELCQILLALGAPDAIHKTIGLARDAKTQEQQIAYLFHLRNITNGWTHDDRIAWFSWFNGAQSPGALAKTSKHSDEFEQWFKDVDSNAREGSSYAGFVRNIRKSGIKSLSDRERFELAGIITQPVGPAAPRSPKKPMQFVKAWQLSDLEGDLPAVSHGRNIAKGKEAYETALCIMCHKYGNEGGAVGPDLTAVASRFARRDLLDNILDPSKVVSEQFAFTTVTKKDGEAASGRVVEDTAEKIALTPNPLAPDEKVEIKKGDIAKRELSKISPMPPGLLNMLTKEEVLDLLAFLESAGKGAPAVQHAAK